MTREDRERTMAEERLGSPQVEARSILESITDGFFVLDRKWCFTYINGAAERMMGARREDLLGRNHWEMFPAAVGTVAEDQYRRAVRFQVPAEFELLYQPWQRWFGVKGYPTSEGGLSVYFRDVTDEKSAREEQQRQWRTFDALLSNIPDHTYIFDPDGRFLYANRAMLELWRKPLEEVTGKHLLDLGLQADVADVIQGQVRQVVNTGQSVRREVEFLDPDGKTQCYEYIFSPILDSSGKVEAIAGCSRDIAERKRVEKVLGERARLNALGAGVGAALTQMQQLPEALQQCTEALVEHLDAAFARIWTLMPAESTLELQASAGLYTNLDGPHARVPVGSFKIGMIAQERRPHLTNDIAHDPRIGDPDWADREGMIGFAGYPLIVEDRLVGVLALFARHALPQDTLDVLASIADSIAVGIERKRAETVLARQAAELARSNADLQQFAHITSHDLQEPLRAMSSFSQILLRRYDGQLDAQAHEFLNYIVSGAQRMKELVNSLLTYSRVVSDQTPAFAPVDLEAALKWATLNLQSVMEETGASVTNDPLPVVNADKVQLVQLFQNLVGNAIKYREADQVPRVHISAEQQLGRWVIAVRDNGIGVPREYAEQIFGVFKRLHGKEIPGTGIGLAICKRIVERHSGQIWVESEGGAGSRFLFSLPA